MGRADYLELGSWNVVCYQCGRKRKASYMRRHWQGYWVCPEHWEPRQAQDFVRGMPDKQTPPWVQPMPADSFVSICTPNGRSGIAGEGVPGCMIPAYVAPGYIPETVSRVIPAPPPPSIPQSAVPGIAIPGYMIPGLI